jgi:hypothetical protein
MNNDHLELQLNSFHSSERKEALKKLISAGISGIKTSENVNMHIHSFFSYNAEGWSPSRIAWEYARLGIYAVGIIDFDVIDGMKEFQDAGELLGLRTSVGIETRAFLTEMADKEIDSPGEPGVSYIAAGGFAKELQHGSPQKNTLDNYHKTADERNTALIDRINPHVSEIAIDYKNDVIPLTPSGNATERHIISAYINQAVKKFNNQADLEMYWSSLLSKSMEEIKKLLQNRPSLEEIVRTKFAKKGGFGYVQPTSTTFPKVEDFFAWVRSCDAIPMESWLDGTSAGEADPLKLLELSCSKGAAALNIIPDRNWNIADPEKKKTKVAHLFKMVETAKKMQLPLHIGTEMNKPGQPVVDDLNGPVLTNFKHDFLKGARIFAGHSLLTRFADFSYLGSNAESRFHSDIKAKNQFFESVGGLSPVNTQMAEKLRNAGSQRAYDVFSDSVAKNKWIL